MGGYIQYQPTDPNEGIARLLQLRLLAQDRDERRADRSEQSRINRLREREAVLKLQELERAAREGEIVRGAMAAGVRPGLQAPRGREGRLGVNIPTGFDRAAALQALAQGEGAHMVPDVQAQFAKEDFTQQEQALKLTEQLAKLGGEQLKNAKQRADIMGSLAQSVIINPASYPAAKSQAEQMGLIQPGQLPEQFTPEMLPQLEMWAKQSMTVKDIITAEETARHNKATESKKTPGVDVPFTPEVEAQKTRIARAGQGMMSSLLTADEVKRAGLPSGTVAQRGANGKIDIVYQPKSGRVTGSQSTALRYLLRGIDATDSVEKVEDDITKMGLGGQTQLNFAPNWLQTDAGKLYNQASKTFTEARLRKDSGAAIPEYEYENDRQMYFARPGDNEEVLKQKRASRATVLEGIAAEAGPAYEDYYGEAFRPGQFKQKYAGAAQPGAQAGPKVGETRQYQGSTYKFDGAQWVKQ